jgi:hypothetical protein
MGSESRKTLPASLAISPEGLVAAVEFRDPCSGVEFHPSQDVRRCIAQALAEWKFAPDVEECPMRYYDRYEYVELRPRDAAASVVASRRAGGCAG